MKIGILGAPKSGKTKLANALSKEYDVRVVDNYVQKIQKSTGLALGPWASYGENLMIQGSRMLAEAKVTEDSITVGTIVDTLCYAAIKTDFMMQQTAEHRQAAYNLASGAMQGLGVWLAETWDYHLCFYLPYSIEKRTVKGRSWEVALDSSYNSVLESFGVTHVFALDGGHADRLGIAKEIIDSVRTEDLEAEEASSAPEVDERTE